MNLLRFLQVILPGIFLLFLGFFGVAWSNEKYAEKLMKDKERARLERIEYLSQRDKPFVFYGKVADLQGNPVPQAKVTMDLSFTPPTPMLEGRRIFEKTTDEQGRFKIDGTGYLLSLKQIERQGYQYHFKYNPVRGFRFQKESKKLEPGQSGDNPALFKVRKKGEPALVLTGHASFQLRPGKGSVRIFDLMKQAWTYQKFLKTEKLNFPDWQEDFQIELTKKDNNYHLLFETLSEGTGIVEGRKEQYLAPAGGYQPTLTLAIPENEPTRERWLFVEGRGGEFYSMLKVETHPSEKWVNVRIGYGTNPNGSRNLEYSPELYQEYRAKKYGRAA
ncbi:MAG TPA: carboxypeptidase-like regulatory domain-containing protein, partial [Desulfuromonadales bacterium]|nr:carboxypeptidase-like regulatory domain-containing protein [Desulfuromonadales bacterium]